MSRELTGPSRTQGKESRYKYCPGCNSNDWSVSCSEDTGAWYCYRCGAAGSTGAGARADVLRGRLTRLKREVPDWPEVELPDWVPLMREATIYLRARGIFTPERFGIVGHAHYPRIIIPYYGEYGRIIYWNTRWYMPDGRPKYIGAEGDKPPYVLPEWRPTNDKVYLVEGPIDAIILHLATGKPVIAIGGTSISPAVRHSLDVLAKGERELILDADALRQTLKLGQSLQAKVTRLERGEGDPANKWRRKAIEAQIHDKESGQDNGHESGDNT